MATVKKINLGYKKLAIQIQAVNDGFGKAAVILKAAPSLSPFSATEWHSEKNKKNSALQNISKFSQEKRKEIKNQK